MQPDNFDWRNYFALDGNDPGWRARTEDMLDKVSTKPLVRAAIQSAHERAYERFENDVSILHTLAKNLKETPQDPALNERMRVLELLKPMFGNRGAWLDLVKAGKEKEIPALQRAQFRITISNNNPPIANVETVSRGGDSATLMVDWIKITSVPLFYKGADGRYHTMTHERKFAHELGHFLQDEFTITFSGANANLLHASKECLAIAPDETLREPGPWFRSNPGESFSEYNKRVMQHSTTYHELKRCTVEKVYPVTREMVTKIEEPNLANENRLMQAIDPTSIPRVNYTDTKDSLSIPR